MLSRHKFNPPKKSAVKGLIAVSCGTPSARLEIVEKSRFLLGVVGDFSGKKVAVAQLCERDKGIPWGYADVYQATKDWAGFTIVLKEAQVFSPAGWFDESASSEMHEQVRLSGGVGQMTGGLMNPWLATVPAVPEIQFYPFPVWHHQKCIFQLRSLDLWSTVRGHMLKPNASEGYHGARRGNRVQ